MTTSSANPPDRGHDQLFHLLAELSGLLVSPRGSVASTLSGASGANGDPAPPATEASAGGLEGLALTATERATIESLVTHHLARVGGDPARALAQLKGLVPPTEPAPEPVIDRTEAWQPHGQPLSGSDGIGPDAEAETVLSDSNASAREGAIPSGERFRILRVHGEGAQGIVYAAMDRELGREVALKRIRPSLLRRHADRDYRDRFQREAEITGRLEHRGIVPVYSLGTGPDGQPFYAMRLVEGVTLQEAINVSWGKPGDSASSSSTAGAELSSIRLDQRGLLRRFVDVCNAVDYAHDRGVIHRDLKPINIKLDHHGETFVMDWGLARLLGEQRTEPSDRGEQEASATVAGLSGSTAATQEGSLLGTLPYMSPEQARGATATLTRASDVYSLGATLYQILTSQHAFVGVARSKEELLKAVREGRFTPPAVINPSLDPALEAVCLKAMAFLPGDRYASAGELAREIVRWLDDEPVLAYPEPWERRLDRWARRHRTLVVSTGLLMAAALAALAVGSVLIRQERDEAVSARDRARAAERQASQARSQAEQGYQLAREAIDTMLLKLGDEGLARSPGLEQVRRQVVNVAVAQSRDLLAERPDDPEVLTNAASVFQRAANLSRIVDDAAGAMALFDEAITSVQQSGSRLSRDRFEADYLLANLLRDRANVRLRHGGPRAAEPDMREAVHQAEIAHDRDPGHVGYRRTLAVNREALGNIALSLGRPEEAIPDLSAAARELETLAGSSQALPIDRMFAVSARTALSLAQRRLGQLPEARATIDAAVSLARADIQRDQGLGDHQLFLALALAEQAAVEPDPLSRFDEAVQLVESVVANSPGVTGNRRVLADLLSQRAPVRASTDPAASQHDLERARTLLEVLDRDSPGTFVYNQLLGRVLAAEGARLLESGQTDAARRTLEQAARRLDAVAAAANDPDDQAARARVRAALDRLPANSDGPDSGRH